MILTAIALALAAQGFEGAENPRSLSEVLYYKSLRATGADLCDRDVALRQQRQFDRRFGQRIATLKRSYEAIHGADPGFDIILTCRRIPNPAEARRDFLEAMDRFEQTLRELEQRYGR